ncbi:hypothetical protein NVSP9465_03395 [Novosphingobium sp. CECT 9465]|nr:hypothetical protein NVSP9465_03395 [Novosphingobium sp. CECT 9465]
MHEVIEEIDDRAYTRYALEIGVEHHPVRAPVLYFIGQDTFDPVIVCCTQQVKHADAGACRHRGLLRRAGTGTEHRASPDLGLVERKQFGEIEQFIHIGHEIVRVQIGPAGDSRPPVQIVARGI